MRKKQNREKIVEAALVSFAKNGFYGTTLDAIAKRAGIAKGTIYLYTSSKEKLLTMIVEEGLERYMAKLKNRWKEAHSERERLRAFIAHQLETAKKYMRTYRALMEEDVGLEKKVQAMASRQRQEVIDALAGDFKGILKKRNGTSAARACMLVVCTSMTAIRTYKESGLSFLQMQKHLEELFLL